MHLFHRVVLRLASVPKWAEGKKFYDEDGSEIHWHTFQRKYPEKAKRLRIQHARDTADAQRGKLSPAERPKLPVLPPEPKPPRPRGRPVQYGPVPPPRGHRHYTNDAYNVPAWARGKKFHDADGSEIPWSHWVAQNPEEAQRMRDEFAAENPGHPSVKRWERQQRQKKKG